MSSSSLMAKVHGLKTVAIASILTGLMVSAGCHTSSTTTFATIAGSAGDGPVSGGTVTVYDANNVAQGSTITDSTGAYSVDIPSGVTPPIRVVITGGIDIVTGQALDIPLEAMFPDALQTVTSTIVNVNPLSTIASAAAKALAGAGKAPTPAQLAAATTNVKNALGFGLDPAIDPVTTTVDANNIASILKANEAAAEFLRRAQASSGGKTIQETITAIAEDITDGVIDGKVAAGVTATQANAALAASANAEQTQVLVEVLTNELTVNGSPVTAALNSAIVTTQPGSTQTIENVFVTEEVKQQLSASGQTSASLNASTGGTNAAIYTGIQTFADNLAVGSPPSAAVINAVNIAAPLAIIATATINTTTEAANPVNTAEIDTANAISSQLLKHRLLDNVVTVQDYNSAGQAIAPSSVTGAVTNSVMMVNLGSIHAGNATALADKSGGTQPLVSIKLDPQAMPIGSGKASVIITLLDNDLTVGSEFSRNVGERQLTLIYDLDWNNDGIDLTITPSTQGSATADYFTRDASSVIKTTLSHDTANVLNVVNSEITIKIAQLFNVNADLGIALGNLVVTGDYSYQLHIIGLPLNDNTGTNINIIKGGFKVEFPANPL